MSLLRRSGPAALGVLVVLAAGLTPGACARSGSAPARHGAITVAVRTPPNSLDPRLGSDETSARVSQLVFNALMRIGDDFQARPDLALRLDQPDPTTYIAHLRPGVRFHDGHLLTSRDVVYTFTSLLAPSSTSPYKGAYRTVASVRALDDLTVEFRLRAPFAAFPLQLVVPPIVPDGAGEGLRRTPIGTGPYRFTRYAVDDEVVLSAFPDYWDSAPRNTGIVLRIVPDDTMRGLELKKGTIDLVVNDLPPDIVFQLERSGVSRVIRSPGLDLSYLGFNLQDAVTRDLRVRRAVGYAINRQAIIDHLRRGLARLAFGLIPPEGWAFEPAARQFRYDPAEARRLLDEAGFPDPDGDGPRPRLSLTLKISTAEEARLQATVIQQDLARVGIELDIRAYEFATLMSDVVKGNFQLFSLQWVGGALVDPDILRRVFHSTQVPPVGFNRGRYANAQVDAAIDRATVALTEGQRRDGYAVAQRLIAEDAPYIPLWNRTNAVVARPELRGVRLGPTGDFQSLRWVERPDPPSGPAPQALLQELAGHR